MTRRRDARAAAWKGLSSKARILGAVFSQISASMSLSAHASSLPLSAFGLSAPGCEAHVSNPLASVSSTTAGGMSQLLVPVPNTASLAGVNLTAQAAGITPNNGAGLATSNGVAGVIGN